MRLKTLRLLGYQYLQENDWILHTVLFGYVVWGFFQALIGKRAAALRNLSQAHRGARWSWMKRGVEPYITSNVDSIYEISSPSKPENIARHFGKRFLVLKPPLPNGEKGVLFVSFSDAFRQLQTFMEVGRLLQDYTLVFEPSYPGFCHPVILWYTQWKEKIFVLAAPQEDYEFLERLDSNLTPLSMGPADWVDPRISVPFLNRPKTYDIVMNAGWMPLKRHYVLFKLLGKTTRKYKVALIGFGKERDFIDDLAAYYRVGKRLTIFENIPYERVMEITCESKVSVLLSLKEGGNRAIAESILCGVPVVLLANHIGGVKKNVVPETGLLATEGDIEIAINSLINKNLSPRKWGEEHISCFKSSEKLNAVLREHAERKRLPWTQNIAARSNSPDSSYVFADDEERLRPYNAGLQKYLKSTTPL